MTLDEARLELDRIDRQMALLFVERLAVIDQVAAIKRGSGAPVHDPERERLVIGRLSALTGGTHQDELQQLYGRIFEISRDRQTRLLTDERKAGR